MKQIPVDKEKNRLRIGIVIDGMDEHLGGTEKQLLQFIERANKKYFDLTLISLSRSPWFKKNSFPCETIFLGYRGFLAYNIHNVLLRFKRILELKRFDILQTFFEESIFMTVAATRFMKNRPLLVCGRRDIGLCGELPWYHAIYRLLRPYIYEFYKAIIVNADAIKEHLVAHEAAPKSKIIVISNGIDTEIVKALPPPIIRDNQSSFWIGLVANLSPVKRIDIFLHALALLRKEFGVNDFKALVIGDGPERETLQKMCSDLNLDQHTYFIGSVANVYSFLQHLNVGVLCSDKEGLSNSILEYMACSLPVVATAVGGNTELVGKDNGFCVPPNDPLALANALATLALDGRLRAQLGLNSRKIVDEQFSWDNTITQYDTYYRQLLDLHGQNSFSNAVSSVIGAKCVSSSK